MDKIGIIDYGVGNLGSVQNAFRFCANRPLESLYLESSQLESHAIQSQNLQDSLLHTTRPFSLHIESKPENLKKYDKLLLPGVGAFGNAMEQLQKTDLLSAVIEFAKSGKYMLGICLGMQLLFEKSFEFGEHKGLGLIEGEIVGFKNIAPLKVPHIGWNSCLFTQSGESSPLLQGINNGSFFYFVHSFHIATQEKFILAKCEYGYPFGAIVNKDNLFGIQPHPEKSHNVGLQLLKNFINLH